MSVSVRRWMVLLLAATLVVAGGFATARFRVGGAQGRSADPAVDAAVDAGPADARCARGFQPVVAAVREVRSEMRNEAASGEGTEQVGAGAEQEAEAADGGAADGGAESEADRELYREAVKELPMLAGTDIADWEHLCVIAKRPESERELSAMFGDRAMSRLAPLGVYRDGAGLSAVRQARAIKAGSVRGTAGKARLYGKGPLVVNSPDYPEVNGLGLENNMGRIDSFVYAPKGHHLFAAVGNGGIWRSDDMAKTWRNATGNLPTTVTGAVGYTSYRRTLLALTGEPTFGSSAYTGLGAYYSADLGKHWKRSKGVPSGALGFAIAVDEQHPKNVYAATQKGLYTSTDGGRSYRNAKLPTGKCAGVSNVIRRPECALASVVTDVVVVAPKGVNTTTAAGTVVATVGWRGGQRTNIDGSVQAPRNGVYRSATGKPGTFAKLATTGFAAQDAIGRIELGNAVGPAQDHDILYAVVEDANLLNNGGVGGIDVPGGTSPVPGTVLNGIYVSSDFGTTWKMLASGTSLALDPTTGSALIGTGTATGYQPGVQSWYNQWIQPDPGRATASGVPTRLAFGLEEIWSNDAPQTGAPLDGSVPTHFAVVAKYFGGASCLLLNVGLPACPTDRDPTDNNDTTHPDQQDGIWIPDASSPEKVQLVVGNDGGAYRYQFENDDDGELDNSHWGPGNQRGFSTLMPYFAAMAKDGTVYGGLQDNGNLKIDGKSRKQYETYGGDGFFAAVDPDNSKTAYEEYTNGAMSVTTDGGSTWADMNPGLTASKFSNPFAMDPRHANHLLTAGNEVVETTLGAATAAGMTPADKADGSTNTWIKVYDLGTRSQPGDRAADPTTTDPANSMSAVALDNQSEYVAFCGYCDTLNKLSATRMVFQNGLATNVGGSAKPKVGSRQGWHIAAARGLPNRYVTSIAVDPANAKKIFVTLGGYTRRWLPPGAVGDVNKKIGTGHLYVSTDAGESFRDVSGNLPDAPANWVSVRRHQLLVGTDVGAFASDTEGTQTRTPRFARLGGLPPAPVTSITLKPGNPNLAVLALFGRDVWTYSFTKKLKVADQPGPVVPVLHNVIKSFDFESGAQGWTTSGTPTWMAGSPGHRSGTTSDTSGSAYSVSGPVGYLDNLDATLTSPSVTVPKGTAVVQWSMRLDTEPGLDIVEAQWSPDGTTWTSLGSFSGQNASAPGWSTYTALLASNGGPIRVRFHFTSDSLCSNLGGPVCSSLTGWDGVHVDDVKVGR